MTISVGVHPAASLIRHILEHGVPISLPLGMDKEEKQLAIFYGAYVSANNEVEFINTDMDEQVQAGHVTVFPLEAVNYLHNLWLSPVAVIPQVGRGPRLIAPYFRLYTKRYQ